MPGRLWWDPLETQGPEGVEEMQDKPPEACVPYVGNGIQTRFHFLFRSSLLTMVSKCLKFVCFLRFVDCVPSAIDKNTISVWQLTQGI